MNDFDQQLVPATNQEIIALAKLLARDHEIMADFERCGYQGDLADDAEARVEEAIDAYRQGPLCDRDRFHLALAPCLVRKLVAGKIEDLESDEVHDFLEQRKVWRIGQGIKSVPTTAAEVMALAAALRKNEEAWSIYARIKEHDVATEEEVERINTCIFRYKRKFGLFNQDIAALSAVHSVLQALASGRLSHLASEAAFKMVRTNPHVVD